MLILLLAGRPAISDELRLDVKSLAEQSVTRDVRLTADGSAIELEAGALYEDDGPAAGYTYKPNEEPLSESVWIKKELVIPYPQAREATLLLAPGNPKQGNSKPGSRQAGGGLKARINGGDVELKSAGKAGNYWEAYTLPADVLKPGNNEIVLSGGGKVWIARAEDFAAGSVTRPQHPNRSFKSTDGGKTWTDSKLGPAGDMDGEYYVRVFLDQFQKEGSLTLPIVDLGNLAGRPIAPPIEALGGARIELKASAGSAGQVKVSARSGTTPVYHKNTWSTWTELPMSGELIDPRGRYVQLAIDLSTADPLQTPRLESVRIASTAKTAEDWTKDLKIVESHNEEIIRSSIPFKYEPFDHPRLAELRKGFQLDEVVAGAKDELELMTRLASWSAKQWDRGHLKDSYPTFDALDILAKHEDGNPVGGFCQHYNLVLLQACESFGIPGRAISIGVGDHGATIGRGGHEVVELWSNQFRKWMYIDGDMAWYAADADSGTPLSLWELRQRQLAAVRKQPFDAIRVVQFGPAKKEWTSLLEWPALLELRLIPRSNFLEELAPLPLNQGMRGWFWTGHYVWNDAEYPAGLLYGNRVGNVRNWEWTLNQAHYTLEATTTPGELCVHLDTMTPGFDTFLAQIDGGGWKSVETGFVWRLMPGANRLEVRPRNIAGREGIVSHVVIERKN